MPCVCIGPQDLEKNSQKTNTQKFPMCTYVHAGETIMEILRLNEALSSRQGDTTDWPAAL